MYGTYWITWINNSRKASHMVGVWKRQNRAAIIIFNALVKAHGKRLDDKSLHTLSAVAKTTVNIRPMTTETIRDVKKDIPLSPTKMTDHEIESNITTSWMFFIN